MDTHFADIVEATHSSCVLSINTMLLLHPLQILLPLLNIVLDTLHLHLLRLMVQHHQIAIHEVEPVQLITRLLGVHDVLVYHVRCAFGGVGGSGADLADGTEFAKEVEEGGRVDVVGEVLDEEDAVGFGGEFVGAGHRVACGTASWTFVEENEQAADVNVSGRRG